MLTIRTSIYADFELSHAVAYVHEAIPQKSHLRRKLHFYSYFLFINMAKAITVTPPSVTLVRVRKL